MSRESSPEDGEILEEGEIAPETSTSDRVRPFCGLPLPSYQVEQAHVCHPTIISAPYRRGPSRLG